MSRHRRTPLALSVTLALALGGVPALALADPDPAANPDPAAEKPQDKLHVSWFITGS